MEAPPTLGEEIKSSRESTLHSATVKLTLSDDTW